MGNFYIYVDIILDFHCRQETAGYYTLQSPELD